MRFIVREIVKDDLPIIYNYLSDNEIAFLTDFNRNINYEDFVNKYNLYFSNNCLDLKIFTIVLDSKVVGKMEIGYDLENKTGTFEIMVGDKQLWGKGIAIKALQVLFSYGFNNLGLNRMSCEVFSFNKRSLKLMKKMNMHVDGLMRDGMYVHDKFVDVYIFSMLRREYEGGE